VMDPEPLGDGTMPPPPDPKLYDTYDGSMGEPKGPALGTEAGPMGKLKDKLT
jgi:Mn-containing catalase